jgi:hypothetical protein
MNPKSHLKSLSERLKLWIVDKSISYHRSELEKLLDWKRKRDMRSVESYEEKAGMSGYIPGLRGEK